MSISKTAFLYLLTKQTVPSLLFIVNYNHHISTNQNIKREPQILNVSTARFFHKFQTFKSMFHCLFFLFLLIITPTITPIARTATTTIPHNCTCRHIITCFCRFLLWLLPWFFLPVFGSGAAVPAFFQSFNRLSYRINCCLKIFF